MTYPTQIDQTEKGLDRLPFILQDQENWQKIITLFLSKVDEIETALYEILTERGINEAIGAQLELIGQILGVDRESRSDDDYRTALLFAIAVRQADTTPDNTISLVKQFTSSASVQLCESGIAFATISVNGQENIGSALYDLVELIRPAGVRVHIHTDCDFTALKLAYESTVSNTESFNVTNDGSIFESFNITVNGSDYEAFFTVGASQEYYEASLEDGRNNFYYETPSTFQVTLDGTTYEDFDLEGTSEYYTTTLKLVTPYDDDYTDDAIVTFWWEVQENSVAIS